MWCEKYAEYNWAYMAVLIELSDTYVDVFSCRDVYCVVWTVMLVVSQTRLMRRSFMLRSAQRQRRFVCRCSNCLNTCRFETSVTDSWLWFVMIWLLAIMLFCRTVWHWRDCNTCDSLLTLFFARPISEPYWLVVARLTRDRSYCLAIFLEFENCTQKYISNFFFSQKFV